MDVMEAVRDGMIWAGREAARLRFIGEVQTRLLALRLARRQQRDALIDKVLELQRAGTIQAELDPMAGRLAATEQEIHQLDVALARARGQDERAPEPPVVTEITTNERRP